MTNRDCRSDILRHDQKCKNMKRSQDMQLIQKLRDNQKRMKKVFEVMSGSYVQKNPIKTGFGRENFYVILKHFVRLQAKRIKLENIVTNSRVTPSWREIVSLTFSELASYT
ncbi:hypothetical protein Tco_0517565 [Tanacetum coccineum]